MPRRRRLTPGASGSAVALTAQDTFLIVAQAMKVVFLPQKREVEMPGGQRVADLLRKLDLLPGTVLVIRGDELLTSEDTVAESDTIEIRNVLSGGSS